jgi:hypothetical protein
LRERGQTDEAEQLRASSLPQLLDAVRTPSDTDATIAERLESVFSVEIDRVANAAVLAELLVPVLSEKLRVASPSSIATQSVAAAPDLAAASVPKPAPARASTISIPDFIDDMIKQESPPERPDRGTQRRAS